MRKPTVILTDPFYPAVVKKNLAPFARIEIAHTRAELFKLITQADGVITRFSDPVDEKLLSHAKKLRAVGNFAVGIDNIDLKACAKRGIRVTNTPDVLSEATAELALALLLAAARRLSEGDRLCRRGKFTGWTPHLLLGIELRGRTAVLVGRGRIGEKTARLFRGIGLKVEWITKSDSDASIQKKLKRAQILSLHFPLTEKTRHWLNARRLALLPSDAIVINTTRGPTIDEKALISTLKSEKIFSAGLDVFENEPSIPQSLRKLPNVVLAPHIGSATLSAREAMARLAISGVLGILSGKHPSNEVHFRRT